MNKRILAFILLFMFTLPLLASCDKAVEVVETEPNVYVVYGIKGEGTTDEAVKAVELEMNRYLLQKANMAIKLYLFYEDEYDQAVKDAFQMMVDAEAEESAAISLSREQAKLSKPANSDASGVEGNESLQTEDVILDILEAGGEIKTKNNKKRFDIFLSRGYEEYYGYITNEETGVMLQKLDTTLTSESKVLLEYIYPSFINPTGSAISAARVNGATYGVPNNGPIGEYQYIVYDKEYLQKYGFDALSMRSLQDLEDYLAVIKQNEPDVIPLYNVYGPNNVSFLGQEGFPVACDEDGFLFAPYLDEEGVVNEVKEYFRMINTYRNLGYFSDGYSDDADFAVRFISGNTSDIAELEQETGKEYDYIVYRKPVATAENTLDNVFCVTKYCASTDVAEVMQFIVLINTDETFRNMFLYGVEDVHYTRDYDGFVTRLNEDYMMSVETTGNAYIAWTLAGEDPDQWEFAKEQNLDSTISPFISFIYVRQEIKPEGEEDDDESSDESTTDESVMDESMTDESALPEVPEVPEAPDDDEDEEVVLEPDYMAIFTEIIDKYWDDLINGTGDFDTVWNNLQSELIAANYAGALRDSFLPQLKKVYASYPTDDSPYSYMEEPEDSDTSDVSE